MGDMYDEAEAAWDRMGRPSLASLEAEMRAQDKFDGLVDEFECATDGPEGPARAAQPDAASQSPMDYYKAVLALLRSADVRPDARRGRYYLPNPDTGNTKSWQRVTNFVKNADDDYHLQLWKQRNVAKGVAVLALTRPGFIEDLAGRSVKADKDRLNEICTRAQDVADAYKMADEGTILHMATEVADYRLGDVNLVLPQHRDRVRLYRDALSVSGITVIPELVERVTASARYEVAGKFDRVYGLMDGSFVVGDLKTGDSLDLSFPSIAAQLECYADGINEVGIFDGNRYDTRGQVRTDFGIVVHLPSTRDEVTVYMVDLDQGRIINATNLAVRDARKIKAKHVASPFDLAALKPTQDQLDQRWIECLNGCYTRDEMMGVAKRARYFGQWNERVANVARVLDAEMAQQIRR